MVSDHAITNTTSGQYDDEKAISGLKLYSLYAFMPRAFVPFFPILHKQVFAIRYYRLAQ
jgi:hypothetical protein